MRNIKLTLEYDGARFFGFQRQKDRPTIQSKLEKALSRLFNRPLKISAAAGRTDSGVHARAQVVNFKIDSPLPLEKVQRGLNALLPREIAVKKIEAAAPDFHARYSAKWKTYEYLVFNSEIRSPLLKGQAFQFPYPLNLGTMRKAARKLVGHHDFKAFQAAGSNVKSSIRFVRRFTVSRVPSSQPSPLWGEGRVRGKLIRFVIEADGFLYHMVRSIVGVLLEVGRGRLSVGDFSRLLKARRRFVHTVPPQGLTLASVNYK